MKRLITLLCALMVAMIPLGAQGLKPTQDPSTVTLRPGEFCTARALVRHFDDKKTTLYSNPQVYMLSSWTEVKGYDYPFAGLVFNSVKVTLNRDNIIAEVLYTRLDLEQAAVEDYNTLLERLTRKYGPPSAKDEMSALWNEQMIFLTKIPSGLSLRYYRPDLLEGIERDIDAEL